MRRIIDELFSRRWFTLDAEDGARLFGISEQVCERILHRLAEAGLIREMRPGIWMRPTHA